MTSLLERQIRALTLALLAVAMPAAGADYPSRPIRYVVAFAPGGLNDVVGRVFCQHLSETW